MLIGINPSLYSYQSLLPYLPVPNLDDTITRYLRTVRPLMTDEEYHRVEQTALVFRDGEGRRLQKYLALKWLISSNYVSDWWEEYVYLRGRSPIMVNSNFYGMEIFNKPLTNHQTARAANCIKAALSFRTLLDRQRIKPIMFQNTVPLCSRQHERQFNTTRIPGETNDSVVHLKESSHIAVYCKGKWYKVYITYMNKSLNAREIESQLQKIVSDDSEPSFGEKHLGAFTAGQRTPWAQARQKYFSTGLNKKSLAAIETVSLSFQIIIIFKILLFFFLSRILKTNL